MISINRFREVSRLRSFLLAFTVGFMALGSGLVNAASNATGSIFGKAASGNVVIEHVETGLIREVSVIDGRFNASSLPVGRYNVKLVEDGAVVATQENVLVTIGAGSEIKLGGDVAELGEITVSGQNISPIDISTTDTRTVFTSEQLEKIPVGRSIYNVALLTPGVVAGDSRYTSRDGTTGVPSFGGSAASENAYYINGYAVTNPLTNLGSTALPFDAIDQYQAITGGYGAEFGRATGGVVNIVTKSGTNEYRAGGLLVFEPSSLRAEQRDRIIPDNGSTDDGLVYQKLSERERDSMTIGAYASGPIVENKAFFYVSYENESREIETLGGFNADPSTNGVVHDLTIPRWLVKLDWNITNNHLLDFTAISDVTETSTRNYDLCYAEGPAACGAGQTPFVRGSTANGGSDSEDGGELYILNYTGYLSNNLTLGALVARQEQEHPFIPFQYDASVVPVRDMRQNTSPIASRGLYRTLPFQDAYDETDGYRLDLEYRLGDHDLKVGYDVQNLESRAGTETAGPGYAWVYEDTATLNPGDVIPSAGGAIVPASREWVRQNIYANGGTFRVEQTAFYIEDRWQLTNDWLISLGLRNEGFTNFNADDIVYVEQKNQLAPRLGVTWDVFGDSTFKVFGQLGRYHLALPNNVALRGAAGSTFTDEYFSFTSIDANGIPQGLSPIGDGPYSDNNEYGQAPDPRTVAAKDLKSHFQDEIVIGMEKMLTDNLNFGARWVYRDLKSAIDDLCDGRAGYQWAIDNGYSVADAEAFDDQLHGCRLFNPGADNTFVLEDASGNLVTLPLTASELGYPELKRTYNGFDFFIEHPFDGEFYYKVDYTWSQSYGNAEGQLQSDIGQEDVSQTIDWDYPELSVGGNGYLPNDRRHYIKANGFWQYNESFRFSGTFSARSGRPKSCLGYYNGPGVDDPTRPDYGPYHHYCDGELSARGDKGRLPSEVTVDLGVTYIPEFADRKFRMSLDIFNVFDEQVVQNRTEIGELGGIGNTYKYYGMPISYSAPRRMRITFRYDF